MAPSLTLEKRLKGKTVTRLLTGAATKEKSQDRAVMFHGLGREDCAEGGRNVEGAIREGKLRMEKRRRGALNCLSARGSYEREYGNEGSSRQSRAVST